MPPEIPPHKTLGMPLKLFRCLSGYGIFPGWRTIVLCSMLLPLLSTLTLAESVWLEAEDAVETNFPPPEQNPFAPQAFWEEDLLSGGQWLGLYWNPKELSQPFIELDFSTTTSGTFALYSRKFFTFGNFRWQIDGGAWHEVPQSLHEPLDSVSLRDNASEKITLSWHYMGSVPLEPGKHRLRIEPRIFKSPQPRPGNPALPGLPLGYDAFVLTSEPFFPNGRLRPGEKFPQRSGNGFAFQPDADRFLESPIDWRSLNEAYAGAGGGIISRDGQLVHRHTGDPVRFFGVNISLGPGASPETGEYLARLLAKKGVNLVRFDIMHLFHGGMDAGGNPTLTLDEASLAFLLEQLAHFKAQGIYWALTWNISTTRDVKILGGFDPQATAYETADLSPHILHDPRYQKLLLDGWQKVLQAKLPDGGTLGADPALALLTLGQQLSAVAMPGPGHLPVPEFVRAQAEAAFKNWLANKYGSVEKAHAAWKKASAQVPGEGQANLPEPSALVQASDLYHQDAVRFLLETQRRWLEKLAGAIRQSTGYQGLISFSNRSALRPDVLGLPLAWAAQSADVTERVGVFAAPYESSDNPWVISAGSRFQDRSALRFDSLPGGEAQRHLLPLQALAYGDKPTLLTEVGWAAPNRFRAEAPLLASTLAALQGVPLLAFQNLAGFNWHQSLPTTRLPVFTPATLGQFPALAYAFREGLLPGPMTAAAWEIPESAFFTLRPAKVWENLETRLDLAPETLNRAPDGAPAALYATGQIRVTPGAKQESLVVEESAAAGLQEGFIKAANGAIAWDTERGILAVKAPKFQALGGFLKQAGPQSAGQMELTSEMDFGVACLVALDSKPLDFSTKMLLQVFSEERNAGEFIEGSTSRLLRSIGRPPVVLQPISGSFSLNRPDAAEITVTALDANGYAVLPVGRADNLRLLPATMYYLLEK